MVLRMSEETELTFKQLRELALAHHIADNRTMIGIWLSSMDIPRDASREITRFTPFTSR